MLSEELWAPAVPGWTRVPGQKGTCGSRAGLLHEDGSPVSPPDPAGPLGWEETGGPQRRQAERCGTIGQSARCRGRETGSDYEQEEHKQVPGEISARDRKKMPVS